MESAAGAKEVFDGGMENQTAYVGEGGGANETESVGDSDGATVEIYGAPRGAIGMFNEAVLQEASIW